jgi:hypothetical protein
MTTNRTYNLINSMIDEADIHAHLALGAKPADLAAGLSRWDPARRCRHCCWPGSRAVGDSVEGGLGHRVGHPGAANSVT